MYLSTCSKSAAAVLSITSYIPKFAISTGNYPQRSQNTKTLVTVLDSTHVHILSFLAHETSHTCTHIHTSFLKESIFTPGSASWPHSRAGVVM